MADIKAELELRDLLSAILGRPIAESPEEKRKRKIEELAIEKLETETRPFARIVKAPEPQAAIESLFRTQTERGIKDLTSEESEYLGSVRKLLKGHPQGADVPEIVDIINKLQGKADIFRLSGLSPAEMITQKKQAEEREKKLFPHGEEFADIPMGQLKEAAYSKAFLEKEEKEPSETWFVKQTKDGIRYFKPDLTSTTETPPPEAKIRQLFSTPEEKVEAEEEKFLTPSETVGLQVPFGTKRKEAVGRFSMAQEDQKKLKQISMAKVLLKQIEGLSKKVNTFEAGKFGLERGFKATQRTIESKLQTDSDATLMDAQSAKLAVLMRSLGEVGVLTDKDISRGEELIPLKTDTKTIANRKLPGLDRFFKATETIIRNPNLSFNQSVIKSALEDQSISKTAKGVIQALIQKGMPEEELVSLILNQ